MKSKARHKLRLRVSALTLVMSVLFNTTVVHAHSEYRVTQNETLSDILWRLQIIPIYGKSGTINKAIELNPKLALSRGELLKPGQILILPDYVQVPTPILQLATHDTPSPQEVASETRKPGSQDDIAQQNPQVIATQQSVTHAPTPVAATPAPTPTAVATRASVAVVPSQMPEPPPKNSDTEELREQKAFSQFIGWVTSGYSALSGKSNSSAEFLSNAQRGAGIGWKQSWSEKVETEFGIEVTQMQFAEPLGVTLTGQDQTVSKLYFGGNFGDPRGLQLGARAFANDVLLYRATSATQYKIEKTQGQGALLQAGIGVLKAEPLSLSLHGRAGVITSKSFGLYPSGNGSIYGAGLRLLHAGKSWSVLGRVDYDEQRLKVKPVEYNFREITIGVGLSWTWK